MIFEKINDMEEFKKFLSSTGFIIAKSGEVYYLKKVRIDEKTKEKLPKNFGYWQGLKFCKGGLRLPKKFLCKIGFYSYDYKEINKQVIQMIKRLSEKR